MNTVTLREHQQAMLVLLAEFDRICSQLGIPYFLFSGSLLGAVRHQGFIPWDDDLDVLMMREDYDRLFREAPAVLDTDRFYLQQEFTEHWPMFFSKLRLNGTACLESYHPKDHDCHQGVYMDIFPCDNAFDGVVARKIQFLSSKVVIAKGLYGRGYTAENLKKKVFIAVCRILPNAPFHRIVRGPKKRGTWVHSFLGGASKYSRSVYPAACFDNRIMIPFEGRMCPAPAKYDELLSILYGDYMRLPPEGERKNKQHAILVDLHHSWKHYDGYRDGMTFERHTRSIR